MNCTRCGMPLEANARFCRNCGQPATPNNAVANPTQFSQQMESGRSPATQPTIFPQPQVPPYQSTQPTYQPAQPAASVPGTMPSRIQDVRPGTLSATGKPRRRGCITGCLITLLVLAVVIGGGWVFALRPLLHSLVQAQVDQVLTNAVNNIPPPAALLPAGTVPVNENAINNLMVLNSSPSDPVQNPQVHILPADVRLDFQVFGFPCAVTAVPQVTNGQLVATNVTVEGIITLIMSPDEVTALANRHLADAQARFAHPIEQVLLKDHELDLIVGPPLGPSPLGSPPPGPPPLP
jgi:hypothetical protein